MIFFAWSNCSSTCDNFSFIFARWCFNSLLVSKRIFDGASISFSSWYVSLLLIFFALFVSLSSTSLLSSSSYTSTVELSQNDTFFFPLCRSRCRLDASAGSATTFSLSVVGEDEPARLKTVVVVVMATPSFEDRRCFDGKFFSGVDDCVEESCRRRRMFGLLEISLFFPVHKQSYNTNGSFNS